jgi:hypothetical protein
MATFSYMDENFSLPSGEKWNRKPNDLYDDLEKIDNDLWNHDSDEAKAKFLRSHGFESAAQFDLHEGRSPYSFTTIEPVTNLATVR